MPERLPMSETEVVGPSLCTSSGTYGDHTDTCTDTYGNHTATCTAHSGAGGYSQYNV